MSRKNRIWYPNIMYHITARGNHRNDIFRDEEDYIVYLTIIEEVLEYYSDDYELISYCLMTNHVHLQIKTKERHIKDFMSKLNSFYVRYFNNKYNYDGHLYKDRYGSEVIENDKYALEVSRYIHLNPVRAKMVERPDEYRWSSYNMYIGKYKEKIIESDKILAYFKKENCRDLYRAYVESAIKINKI